MMCRRSFSRPGAAGLPAFSQSSRELPPFQARVVKPSTSVLTPQRSSVRARMSAQTAATMIGLPRMDPELSMRMLTTVSRNSVSSSSLKAREAVGSMMTRVRRATSRIPSSRSKVQDRFCWAISLRCSLLARRETTVDRLASCWSR